MAAGKRPAPVTGTITAGLVSCSIAVLTDLVHGSQSLVIAAASFGLASLVRGGYTVARAFDRWQALQSEQDQPHFQVPLSPESSDV